MTMTRPNLQPGFYLDGSSDEAFAASFEAVMSYGVHDWTHERCVRCGHERPATVYGVCAECGGNTFQCLTKGNGNE